MRRLFGVQSDFSKATLIHPILLGCYPALALYAQNTGQVAFSALPRRCWCCWFSPQPSLLGGCQQRSMLAGYAVRQEGSDLIRPSLQCKVLDIPVHATLTWPIESVGSTLMSHGRGA